MTGKLSQPLDTMKRFPDVCPIDGRPVLGAVSVHRDTDRAMIRSHFVREHRGRTGLAFRKDDAEPFEFAYIEPEPGSGRWRIVTFDWPFEIVLIRPDDYRIHWIERKPE